MTTKKTSMCLVMMAAISMLLFSAGTPAHAHGIEVPVPTEQLDDAAKLVLARALVGEADWNTPDHKGIAWVLGRRWRSIENKKPGTTTFAAYVAKYSSPLKVKTKRTEWVQSLPWGDLPDDGKLAPFKKHWARVRMFVEAWSEGRIPDPCPSAAHWGGTMDHPGPSMRAIPCGLTRNIFYKHRAVPKP